MGVGVGWLVWQGSAMRRPPPGLGPVRYAYAPPSVEKLLGALPVVARTGSEASDVCDATHCVNRGLNACAEE